MDSKSIAWQIKARMEAKGISRQKMMEALGLERRAYYLVMSNRVAFKVDLVKRISEVLECTMEDLTTAIPELYK